MDNKKTALIDALKAERQRMINGNHSPLEHDIAIEYLEKGTTTADPDKWELLDACMNDYETVLLDYDIH